MKERFFRRHEFVYSIAGMITGMILTLLISSVASSQEITLSAPQNGATVSGTTQVTIGNYGGDVEWANFYLDGAYQASTPPLTWYWSTSGVSGSHTVSVNAFS